jgi:hypothetical protein
MPDPALGCPGGLPVVLGCPSGLPVVAVPGPVIVPVAFGFTAFEPLVPGAGEGEFSVPSLPVVVPAPPVPE